MSHKIQQNKHFLSDRALTVKYDFIFVIIVIDNLYMWMDAIYLDCFFPSPPPPISIFPKKKFNWFYSDLFSFLLVKEEYIKYFNDIFCINMKKYTKFKLLIR